MRRLAATPFFLHVPSSSEVTHSHTGRSVLLVLLQERVDHVVMAFFTATARRAAASQAPSGARTSIITVTEVSFPPVVDLLALSTVIPEVY